MDTNNLYQEYIQMYWKTVKNIDDLISVPMAKEGLSFEQFLIMSDLVTGKQISVTQISKMRQVTTSAVSRQIKSLIQRNLIVQVQDSEDRRKQYLQLTKEGQTITEKLITVVEKRFNDWVGVIGKDDAQEFLRLMKKIGDFLIEK